MNSDELKKRTKIFAHRCIKVTTALPKTLLGNYIAGQLIRSAISVASNYRAACFSQSKKDFAAKISIALEEADESSFWIEMVIDELLLEEKKLIPLKKESDELTRILAASRITARKKKKTEKPIATE